MNTWYQDLEDESRKLGYRFSKLGLVRPVVFARDFHWWMVEAQSNYTDCVHAEDVPNPFPKFSENDIRHNLKSLANHGYIAEVEPNGLIRPGEKYIEFCGGKKKNSHTEVKIEIQSILSEVFRELSQILK